MNNEIVGTGLAFPFDVDASGRIALVSDHEDIDQAIRLIINTRPGERPMRPEFGCAVHDHVFDQLDASATGKIELAIRAALDRWEPRVEVQSIEFDDSARRLDAGTTLRVGITFRVRPTNSVRNLVHPFYVMPAEGGEA